MLHVTNGDAAAGRMAEAGLPGQILPWRDVLHEGPVPAGLSLDELRPVRATFLAGCGWAELDTVLADLAQRDAALAGFRLHDETVLWFEPDLYDQLQLLQLLDRLAESDLRGVKLSVVHADDYLGPGRPEGSAWLRSLFEARHPATGEELRLGRLAWQAFTAADPNAIVTVLAGDTSALPYLAGALRRHLRQFPSAANGLSRSEEQALAALSDGARTPAEAFVANQAGEEFVFLGDTIFGWYLERLGHGAQPLVVWSNGEPLPPPDRQMSAEDFRSRGLRLTDLGRAVLAGSEDWIKVAGIDRWLGGAHLTTAEYWRWDEDNGSLARSR